MNERVNALRNKLGVEGQLDKATPVKRAEGNAKSIEYLQSLKSYPVFNYPELAKRCYAAIFILEKDFVFTDRIKMIYKNLCMYFSGEEGALNANKGIALVGCVGAGKTIAFKAVQMALFKQPAKFNMISTINVVKEFEREDSYERFCKGVWCFDDLGTEPPPKFAKAGQAPLFNEILQIRYQRGLLTHITSNLTFDEMGELYGVRVESRMNEMFNLIEWDEDIDHRSSK